eukprot:TRINITY_DN15047_c0_g4_i1.p1 TRINITY_DN15047_c0_g4~~TRINITY_DN15047_c0_g4_i1.p1  ORF type:complete len:242 (+),score=37.02 TRINITY_DN15047_c0_g4_i1:61-786(+)
MSAEKWLEDFRKARAVFGQLQADLQHWELLTGDRARKGADIRGRAYQLKIDLERLQRELEAVNGQTAMQSEEKRKQVMQFREDLRNLDMGLKEVQQRLMRTQPQAPTGSVVSSGSNSSAPYTFAPSVRSEPDSQQISEMSNRQLVERQRQIMNDLNEPLAELEASVSNLGAVSNMIHGEIVAQNRMLSRTNEDADRAEGRLQSIRNFMERVTQRDRNRFLLLSILVLLAALIVIAVWVIEP